MAIVISKHGKQRLRERLCISGKKQTQTICQKARRNGQRFNDIENPVLRAWLYSKFKNYKEESYLMGMKTNHSNYFYIYDNTVFIFNEVKYKPVVLITVYKLPEHIQEHLLKCEFDEIMSKVNNIKQLQKLILKNDVLKKHFNDEERLALNKEINYLLRSCNSKERKKFIDNHNLENYKSLNTYELIKIASSKFSFIRHKKNMHDLKTEHLEKLIKASDNNAFREDYYSLKINKCPTKKDLVEYFLDDLNVLPDDLIDIKYMIKYNYEQFSDQLLSKTIVLLLNLDVYIYKGLLREKTISLYDLIKKEVNPCTN